MRYRFFRDSTPHPLNSEGEHSEIVPLNIPEQNTRDPYRRACEFEPGYDWRTDPYYDEDAIRERLRATKAQMENTDDRTDQ